MKCYNSFGEMFNAQSGGDRSVFNGIAQAKITTEDNYGNESDPVYFRLSTRDRVKPISVAWSKDGKKYAPYNSSAPREVHDAAFKSGLRTLTTEFTRRYNSAKGRKPGFDWTAISDGAFVKDLNDFASKNGVSIYWAEKDNGGSSKDGKTEKSNINIIKATGIFSQGGKYSFVKYGLEHGEPFAVRYDEHGTKLGRIPPEKLVGKNYVADTLSSPEKFAKVPNDDVADLIEYTYLHKHNLKVSDVLWKGGDVNFKTLIGEFQHTLSTREKQKQFDEDLIEKRLKDAEDEDFKKKSLIGQGVSLFGKGLGKLAKKSGIKKLFVGD